MGQNEPSELSILRICNHDAEKCRSWFPHFRDIHYSSERPPGLNPLVPAAYFGHKEVVKRLLSHSDSLDGHDDLNYDCKDILGQAPLFLGRFAGP
ncbi:hypothetical protein BO71DRAFT_12771 [Aspergillus ellipticus CBS 707.79]|uniref:Uncharacterized protein n=1 Tax=Aspergillus ellipticus CBS 707.79 TaxID=1448320 RepID=A0A319EPL2_9EURO|nr:hypothetical protein BO71DRAFT_12771 [Aspergillus ellipticus CBS 707.79]